MGEIESLSNQIRGGGAAHRPPSALSIEDSVDHALAICIAAAANLARVTSRVERSGRLLGAIAAADAQATDWADGSRAAGLMAGGLARGLPADPLTPRQREVAILVAQGLTNRQIADVLVISERTVDTHVQNILSKLELATRTQVATWLLERMLSAAPAGRSPR